jgi:hypothetical protein
MESRCMILKKNKIKKNIFWMFYSWYCKPLNFEICRHYRMHLTPKGLRVPYVEFGDSGQAITVSICMWIFWNFYSRRGFEGAFQQAIASKIWTISSWVMRICFFRLKWGQPGQGSWPLTLETCAAQQRWSDGNKKGFEGRRSWEGHGQPWVDYGRPPRWHLTWPTAHSSAPTAKQCSQVSSYTGKWRRQCRFDNWRTNSCK